MNSKPLLATLGVASALVLTFALPDRSNGQAAAGDASLAALVTEITAQQAAIAENQTKMEGKIATIAEDIRIARIFVARGGGKTK
jgi:hypothetical protein